MTRSWLGITLLWFTLALPVRAVESTPSGFEVTTIVLTPQGDTSLAEPARGASMNLVGDVLFSLSEGGKDVLYLRFVGGNRIRVLGAGDGLAGSRVARLVSSPTSLDAYRQILLYAVLEDGRAGLFRLEPVPAPFSVTPKEGSRREPISFHLLGDAFTPGVEVFFGDTKAGFVTVLSRTELTGVLAPGSAAGVVDVSVGRPGLSRRSLKGAFEFRDAPMAGCQGLWPDHRPPVRSARMLLPWMVGVVAVAERVRRRRKSLPPHR